MSDLIQCGRYQTYNLWWTFFKGAGSLIELFFHLWNDIACKFVSASNETIIFLQALSREERKTTWKEIVRNDVTRAFHVRNTDFPPTRTSTLQSCTEPRRCGGEHDMQMAVVLPVQRSAGSSWHATRSRGQRIIFTQQQQVIVRRAAKEILHGRKASVHHCRTTFIWKKPPDPATKMVRLWNFAGVFL